MRKRKLTSILALALALLLAVSLLCAPALADEEDDPGEGSESPYTDL